MSIILFVEETQFQGLILTFKENDKRISPFSSQLSSEARELYRKITNYGNVTHSFVHYLTISQPTHPIIINTKNYQGTVYWANDAPVEVKLCILLNEQGVNVQFRQEVIQEGKGEIIWLTDNLLIYPDNQILVFETEIITKYKKLYQNLITQWPAETTVEMTQSNPLCIDKKDQTHISLWTEENRYTSTQEAVTVSLQINYQRDSDIVSLLPLLTTATGANLSLKSVTQSIFELCPQKLQNTPLFFEGLRVFLDTIPFSSDQASDQDSVSALNVSALNPDHITLMTEWQTNINRWLMAQHTIISAHQMQWITSELNSVMVMKVLYFIWHHMTGEKESDYKNLRFSKSQFHQLLPKLEKWCKAHTIQVKFSTETVETVDWDITLNDNLDLKKSIWDQVTITGMQTTDLTLMNKVRMSDWIISQAEKTLVITPETQEKINALFITAELTSATNKKQVTIPYQVSTMIHYLMLYQSGIKITIPQRYQTRIQKLISGKTAKTETVIPNGLNMTPRDYQIIGYQWLVERHSLELGAVLADEMGLGKTLQAIMMILAITQKQIQLHTKDPKILIVVPPSLLYNWHNEITTIYDKLDPLLYFGSKRNSELLKETPVTITSYDLIRRDLDEFKLIEYEMVIFDEAQWVKNIKARRSIASRYINRKFTLCLTGTPLENHVGDYYAIMDLAIPGILGTLSTFQTLYQDHGDQWLKQRTAPFILRRLKVNILDELPKKTEQTVILQLSSTQKTLYHGIVQKIKQSRKNSENKNSIQILTAILRLRQLCITPQLLNAEGTDLSPKFNYLCKTIPDILENNHSCLLYSQFAQVLDKLVPIFKKENIPFLRIDGTVPAKKRQDIVNQFQSKDAPPMVLMMTLKTGGVGLNLTRASYVIHLDPWWNPATEDQATDRAHRIGQTEPVSVYKLVMKDSIEEKVLKLKQEKQKLLINILETSGKITDLKHLDLTTLITLL
jgi:superfamily II DNA or RNA helicase